MRSSKQTLSTSTILLHSLRWSKRAPPNTKVYTLVVFKTDSLHFYKPSTRCAVVKTENPHYYKLSTGILVVKTDPIRHSTSHCTRFAIHRTGNPNFYKSPTLFALLKTDSIRTFASLLHALQCSKRTLQTSTSLLHVYLW